MGQEIELGKKGIVYAAIGEKFINEAVISATSVKQQMPHAQVILFTTSHVDSKIFDKVINLSPSADGFKGIKLYKPLALLNSPFETTLFLDTDTYICDDCQELFDMAGVQDLILAHDTADMSMPHFYPYNSGVMAFRKSEKLTNFLQSWHDILESDFEEHPWDQRAMMKSILENKLTTYTLQPVYNCRTNFIVSLPQLPVKIIHGRDIDFLKVEKELNRVLKNRVWMPKRQQILLKKKRNFVQEIFRKIKNRVNRKD